MQINTFNKKDFWSTPRDVIANVKLEETSIDAPLGRVIGQYDNGIILSEVADGIVIIDQHAAYEKIIQEKLNLSLETRLSDAKRLELPQAVEVSPNPISMDVMLAMSNLGFDIQNNDEGSASLLKIPYFIFPSMELFDIITKTLENPSEILVQEFKSVVFDLANVSCRMAIKYGDAMSVDQMNLFLREMEKFPNSLVCNHGRPTTKLIKKSDLLKEFNRV